MDSRSFFDDLDDLSIQVLKPSPIVQHGLPSPRPFQPEVSVQYRSDSHDLSRFPAQISQLTTVFSNAQHKSALTNSGWLERSEVEASAVPSNRSLTEYPLQSIDSACIPTYRRIIDLTRGNSAYPRVPSWATISSSRSHRSSCLSLLANIPENATPTTETLHLPRTHFRKEHQ